MAKKPVKSARRVCYINAFGKPVYYSGNMEIIMDARTKGELQPGRDWYVAYLNFLPIRKAAEEKLQSIMEKAENKSWCYRIKYALRERLERNLPRFDLFLDAYYA